MTNDQFAVTNARFVSLHGLPVAPASPAPTPVPLHKPRARHELAFSSPNRRRASVCGSAAGRSAPAAFRYSLHSVLRSTPPLAGHRPKPDYYFLTHFYWKCQFSPHGKIIKFQ